MFPVERYQRFSVQDTLGAGDASKTLVTGGAGITIVVTTAIITCITAAAQATYVGDTSGTVKALSVAASFSQHLQASVQLLEGLKLTEGENLIIKPAAAGPSFHAVVEGYLLKSNVNLGAA